MPPDELTTAARPLEAYVEHLMSGEPFAFSRWGDGEWNAILGLGVRNTDKQVYTPELRADLTRVLEDRPPYRLGLQPLAVRLLGPQIAAWLEAHDWRPAWEDSDVWHRASKAGQLAPLVAALRRRRLLFVGPSRLAPVAERLGAVASMTIPPRDAHARIAQIRRALQIALRRLGKGGVVAMSAGMCANLLIHDYCARRPVLLAPARTTWIDFGAVWEPYAGIVNRSYHQVVIDRLGAENRLW